MTCIVCCERGTAGDARHPGIAPKLTMREKGRAHGWYRSHQ